MRTRGTRSVFADPSGRRLRWTRYLVLSLVSILLIIVGNLLLLPFFLPSPTAEGLPSVSQFQDSRSILIVFDGAPDPQDTPLILETLRSANTAAVFLVSGARAYQENLLLREIVSAGHMLSTRGSTLTQDDPFLTQVQRTWMLQTTQTLVASATGSYVRLWHASLPTIDPVIVLDTNDWPKITPGQFARRVAAEVGGGKRILLLHQGDGSETMLKALPTILTLLSTEGYHFVSGKETLIHSHEQFFLLLAGVGFTLLRFGSGIVLLLAFLSAVFGIVRMIFIALAALYRQTHRRAHRLSYAPSLTVIVPAYNEAKVIGETVSSLLKSKYLKLKIVIVDDGSSDSTPEVIRTLQREHPQVDCLFKANSGKANSINFALKQVRSELVVIIDADTQIKSDALLHLVQPFYDPRVAAVAGNAKVGNRLNLVTKFQALEYITSQNLERRALALLNCIKVVPGAIGAWRTQAIKKAGGFTHDTLAEDADLTLKLLRLGYRVEYAEEAVAYTEAPDTFFLFMQQRFRWMFGTLQAVWKHSDVLLTIRTGRLGFFVVGDAIIFQVIFPFLSPIMDIYLLSYLLSLLAGTSISALPFFYYAIFLVFDYLSAVIAFLFERREDRRLLRWLFVQRLVYRELLGIVALRCLLAALRGRVVEWNKLDRKATVTFLR